MKWQLNKWCDLGLALLANAVVFIVAMVLIYGRQALYAPARDLPHIESLLFVFFVAQSLIGIILIPKDTK